jgi:hypothetical protein
LKGRVEAGTLNAAELVALLADGSRGRSPARLKGIEGNLLLIKAGPVDHLRVLPTDLREPLAVDGRIVLGDLLSDSSARENDDRTG